MATIAIGFVGTRPSVAADRCVAVVGAEHGSSEQVARPARSSVGWSKTRVAGSRRPVAVVEPVAQLDRGQRVEAQLLERPVRLDGVGRRVPEHRGDLAADQVQQHRSRAVCRARRAAASRRGGSPVARAGRRRTGEMQQRGGARRTPAQRAGGRGGPAQARGVAGARRASNSASPSSAVSAGRRRCGCIRARSASVSSPVMPRAGPTGPRPARCAGSPRARRCGASASRKALAAA